MTRIGSQDVSRVASQEGATPAQTGELSMLLFSTDQPTPQQIRTIAGLVEMATDRAGVSVTRLITMVTLKARSADSHADLAQEIATWLAGEIQRADRTDRRARSNASIVASLRRSTNVA